MDGNGNHSEARRVQLIGELMHELVELLKPDESFSATFPEGSIVVPGQPRKNRIITVYRSRAMYTLNGQ